MVKKRIAFTITPTEEQDDWLREQATRGFRSVNSIVLEMISEKMLSGHQKTSFHDVEMAKAPNA